MADSDPAFVIPEEIGTVTKIVPKTSGQTDSLVSDTQEKQEMESDKEGSDADNSVASAPPPPTQCGHVKRSLDPHSLCDACKRKHNLVLCYDNSRCDQCRYMDVRSFEVLMAERKKTAARYIKKNSPKKQELASRSSPRKPPGIHSTAQSYCDADYEDYEEPLVPTKKQSKTTAKAMGSVASSMNVDPEKLKNFLADPDVIASLTGEISFNPDGSLITYDEADNEVTQDGVTFVRQIRADPYPESGGHALLRDFGHTQTSVST